FGADVGVGITGIAGPGGGTKEKPVGLVCFCVAERDSGRVERATQLPGGRVDVRDRSTTVAMHLLRRLLRGERDDEVPGPDAAAVGEATWLPDRRPRVLAVDLDDPEGRLGQLQGRVSDALAAEAGYRPESRPFRPHVTVARVRRGERMRPRPLPDPPAARFAPPALTLYRSRLSRAGAEYEALARAELS